jgi:hypothetical protein
LRATELIEAEKSFFLCLKLRHTFSEVWSSLCFSRKKFYWKNIEIVSPLSQFLTYLHVVLEKIVFLLFRRIPWYLLSAKGKVPMRLKKYDRTQLYLGVTDEIMISFSVSPGVPLSNIEHLNRDPLIKENVRRNSWW